MPTNGNPVAVVLSRQGVLASSEYYLVILPLYVHEVLLNDFTPRSYPVDFVLFRSIIYEDNLSFYLGIQIDDKSRNHCLPNAVRVQSLLTKLNEVFSLSNLQLRAG